MPAPAPRQYALINYIWGTFEPPAVNDQAPRQMQSQARMHFASSGVPSILGPLPLAAECTFVTVVYQRSPATSCVYPQC